MQLQKIENTLTMSSREVAELTLKEHKNVKRDIIVMLEELEKDALSYAHIYTDSVNRQQTEYLLDKELTLTLLHGYKFMSNKAYSKVVEHFKDSEITPKFARKEYSFGEDIVKKLFNGYAVIRQFPVLGKYKLDWYVPELKLAIEFDEQHHGSKKDKDSKRQKEIEKSLGCRFLRYNAD